MKKLLVLLLSFILIFCSAACQETAPNPTDTQTTEATEQKKTPGVFTSREPVGPPLSYISSAKDYFDVYDFSSPEKEGNLELLFHQPFRGTDKDYPLIIYLHGLGEDLSESHLGTSGTMVETLINLENESDEFSAYTLVPITPTDATLSWTSRQYKLLLDLIPYLKENYAIDTKRVYVTGISMGGFTTCQLVNDLPPETFAAVIPLSGARNLKQPEAHMDTAFYIHHSTNDTVVDVSCARNLYQQLVDCKHPNAKYVEYPDGTHSSTQYSVFRDRLFYNWLFARHLP